MSPEASSTEPHKPKRPTASNDCPFPERPDAWALALSGGGIRSATFCLGLVRGLAQRKQLLRFGYLSTVSGGGYLGASLGRLFHDNATPALDECVGISQTHLNHVKQRADDIQDGIADRESMWLWWLRNNGRYLTPSGAKDLGMAGASILRGIFSTHMEMGALLLLLSALTLFPRMALAAFAWQSSDISLLSLLPSVWGWLMVLPAWFGIFQIFAYWYVRPKPNVLRSFLNLLAVAAFAVTTWIVADGRAPWGTSNAVKAGAAIFVLWLSAPVVAAVIAPWCPLSPDKVAELRLTHTRRLSVVLWILAAMFALVLLERGAWRISRSIWDGDLVCVIAVSAAIAAGVIVAVQWGLPIIQHGIGGSRRSAVGVQRTLNVVGAGVIVAAALFWTTILTAIVYHHPEQTNYWGLCPSAQLGKCALLAFLLVVVVCGIYSIVTREDYDLLNLASLHNYYRARIERAYVSSGNPARYGGLAWKPPQPGSAARIKPLTEAIPKDDIDIASYKPHLMGGPIHLINCCINQTVDDRTDLYNADRKGVALTVSALGVEIGTRPPVPSREKLGRLSKWTAISGAAAGSGMGSQTSPGLAALLFMSGVRLGFWMPKLRDPAPDGVISGPDQRDRLLRAFPKSVAVIAESLARFPGLGSPFWYVSDGGHFDNTGIYALLKRRPSVIVAADCGADPEFQFGDVESLVRKAKIDYRADIDFINFDLDGASEAAGTFVSVSPRQCEHPLLLACIRYEPIPGEAQKIGALIVVKPRVLGDLPFDTLAYATRNPTFPQQTTGDQFFDEAQWEAYHELGEIIGRNITDTKVALAQQVVALYASQHGASDKPKAGTGPTP